MTTTTQAKPLGPALFKSTHVRMTHGIAAAFPEDRSFLKTILDRHFAGDWGDTGTDKDSPEELSDWELNDFALLDGSRILSVFHYQDAEEGKVKLYIITEATDSPNGGGTRSATTIMLPSEY